MQTWGPAGLGAALPVPLLQALVVGLGAALGAMLRWRATVWLAPMSGWLPLGTLLVNAAGGFLAGCLLAVFQRYPHEWWRLALMTGFLGGLTTFSAFSAESLGMLLQGHFAHSLFHALIHVLGALLCAALGLGLVKFLAGWH